MAVRGFTPTLWGRFSSQGWITLAQVFERPWFKGGPTLAPEVVPQGILGREFFLDHRRFGDPDWYFPPVERPLYRWERVRGGPGWSEERLAFPSPFRSQIPENNQVRVRVYLPTGLSDPPMLIVLHGVWRPNQLVENRLGRDLARLGIGTAIMTLPYHWERSPRGVPSGAYFLSPNALLTAEAYRQGLLDVRALAAILRHRHRRVGIFGISLGGVMAHVAMALEPFQVGISLLAGANCAGIVWEGSLTRHLREALVRSGIRLAELTRLWASGNPIHYARAVKTNRILMINGLYDGVVPRRFTLELWEALGRPSIRWYPTGHSNIYLFWHSLVRQISDFVGGPVPPDGRPTRPSRRTFPRGRRSGPGRAWRRG